MLDGPVCLLLHHDVAHHSGHTAIRGRADPVDQRRVGVSEIVGIGISSHLETASKLLNVERHMGVEVVRQQSHLEDPLCNAVFIVAQVRELARELHLYRQIQPRMRIVHQIQLSVRCQELVAQPKGCNAAARGSQPFHLLKGENAQLFVVHRQHL